MALLLDGVVLGLQLSLLAVGLTLVYGLGGVLNLAYGQLVAGAAIVGAVLLRAGVATPLALVVAVLGAGVLAVAMDRTVLRPVYRRAGEARVLLGLLVTLAVAFLLDGLLIAWQPFTALSLSVGGSPIPVLGVRMRVGSLVASGVAVLVLGGLIALLGATRLGKAIRSIIQDETGARLCGIDPAAVRTLVFAISGVLAGVVAITQALTASVGASAGLDLTILALIVTVVGGLGRVTGALVAGVLLGIVTTTASYAVGTYLTYVILLVVAMLTIVLRPSGILGRAGS
jgi:branched-chain amino acid transport system permease protein